MTALRWTPNFAKRWHHYWGYVVDVGLTVWVLRAPVGSLIAGSVILLLMPQGQDLFVDLALAGRGEWVKFLLVLILVWAAPTDYASRILLGTDERYCVAINEKRDRFREWLKDWSPNILTASVFACILVAVLRSLRNVPSLPPSAAPDIGRQAEYRLILFALVIAGLSVAFWCFTLARDRIVQSRIVIWGERAAAVVLEPVRQILPRISALYREKDGSSEIDSDLGPLLLFIMFVLFAALPMFFPLEFANAFPRAAAVPFVIGGWIPLLAILSGLGRRLHAPLLLFFFILKTVLPLSLSPDYVIPVKPATAQQVTGISLNGAVDLWKHANNCAGAGQRCPRPIIVAAAGGASRAGFFTASVIGQMLDDELKVGEGLGHRLSPPEVTNRLFAFSTVSGSSIAAVMTVAAMASSEDGISPPCRHRLEGYWDSNANLQSWRSCLETLLSGDFLTPIFTGLVFHDAMPFPLTDRGRLLAESWRKQFLQVIGSRQTPDPGSCIASLECAFASLRPTDQRWLPLLVLNGTSVDTGQRIITTMLQGMYRAKDDCPIGPRGLECHLFLDAYRFHDLLNDNALSGETAATADRALDIDLSTAALNSARFPLLSPPGEIRDKNGRLIDEIVDGGYFENFGVRTATELAQAIKAIDPKLNPFLLLLSNNPQVVERNNDAKTASLPRRRTRFATDFSGPVTAFANTRDARGALALDEARALLHPENVAQIRVWANPLRGQPDISMSWWLSKPLQLELHEQTEIDRHGVLIMPGTSPNCRAIQAVLVALASPAAFGAEGQGVPCTAFEDQ